MHNDANKSTPAMHVSLPQTGSPRDLPPPPNIPDPLYWYIIIPFLLGTIGLAYLGDPSEYYLWPLHA